MHRPGTTGCWLVSIATIALGVAPAYAQMAGTPQADSNEPSGGGIAEVVVTAERKSESLSRTPVAVAVLSSDELTARRIVTEQDLQSTVPGLQVRGTLDSEQLNYTLRGQSVDAFSNARPGVLPYVNEVQIGGPGASSAFYDLDSIQVLKGPQGILFGRSATGGAVLFTTKKPQNTFGGYGEASVGNYGTSQFDGALNLPVLPDALLLRLAGIYQKHDGYQHNLYDGTDLGGTERVGGRISGTVKFSSSVYDDVVLDYLRSTGSTTEAIISGLQPTAPIAVSQLYAGGATPQQTATGIAALEAFSHLPAATATSIYNSYFATHDPQGLTAFAAAQQDRGPFTVDIDVNNAFSNHNTLVTNAFTDELNDDTKVKNILGYTHLTQLIANDTDGTAYDIGEGTPAASNREIQYSEEAQLLGKALSNRLDYIAGFYYSHEQFESISYSSSLDILGPYRSVLVTHYRQYNTTYAGYGHATYELNDQLSANAGVRFTSEKVEVVNEPDDGRHAVCANPGYNCDQSKTFNNPSWQVGLNEQLNPHLLLYMVSRRAYKSGGFNGQIAPKVGNGAAGGNGFTSESVTDVELGAKFNGMLEQMPAQLNAALYHDWQSDGQRTAYTVAGIRANAVTANVPRSRVYGVELDGKVNPSDWLSLGITGAFTHATFSGVTSGFTALPGCRGATVVAAGTASCFDQVPDAPKWSVSPYADITEPVGYDLEAVLHADVYYQTSTTTSTLSANSVGTKLPAYSVADFGLGLQDQHNRWSVMAAVKNAFDRVYFIGGIPLGTVEQFNTRIPGVPRTYSLTGRLRF